MPSTIGKCKLFRIKHITLLEGETFSRNKHEIAFFEIKCTFFGRKENTIKVNRLTSTSWMLDTLKWLNIKERLQVNTIYFIRKMKIADAPDYLTEQLRYVGEVQPYSLRNVMNFRIQQANTTAK